LGGKGSEHYYAENPSKGVLGKWEENCSKEQKRWMKKDLGAAKHDGAGQKVKKGRLDSSRKRKMRLLIAQVGSREATLKGGELTCKGRQNKTCIRKH